MGRARKMRHFDHGSALVWKKLPSAAACPLAWRIRLLISVTVLEVHSDVGAKICEVVSEGDIVLGVVSEDNVSSSSIKLFLGEWMSREVHCLFCLLRFRQVVAVFIKRAANMHEEPKSMHVMEYCGAEFLQIVSTQQEVRSVISKHRFAKVEG